MNIITQINQTNIIPNSLAIWGMGQMGVGVKTPKAVLYIDLCLSDSVREQFGDFWTRAYDPPIEPDQINNADYYLITHEHMDHLDPQTVGPIGQASPNAMFVAPGWCVDLLHECGIDSTRIILPEAMVPFTLPGTDVTVTAVPSAHYEKEYDPQKGYRWLGYLIESNGVRFYHAGDTIIYDGYIDTLRKLPQPDVAMLPVNGRDHFRETEGNLTGNLLPIEAARLAHDLGWDVLIPGHNDLYANNMIPFREIINALETTAPRQKYKVLQPGELYYYVK
jgi:L-ascorbate metabolism protein UlaG (beta-lactamase superfamily)